MFLIGVGRFQEMLFKVGNSSSCGLCVSILLFGSDQAGKKFWNRRIIKTSVVTMESAKSKQKASTVCTSVWVRL